MASLHSGSSSGPYDTFSLADTINACEGTPGTQNLQGLPLRVLISHDSGKPYELVPYTGQPYIAISYCWPAKSGFERIGASKLRTTIQTSHGPVISEHFSQFMAHTVDAYNSSLGGNRCAVWIDYHCINQRDREETAAQVAILQHIYARAHTTFIILEDISLSTEELTLLVSGFRSTPRSVSLLRRIISARWFERAWCSQELVLSCKATLYLQDTGNPSIAHGLIVDTLWTCLDIARNTDASIPVFSQARGSVPDAVLVKTTAWALGIVHHLGCSDEYDKVSLIFNILRYVFLFRDRPNAFSFDTAPPIPEHVENVRLNVLKMANVTSITRRDASMLLLNHIPNNPFQGKRGFGWAGAPLRGDQTAEWWIPKDYDVAHDPDLAVTPSGLLARGVLARIDQEHEWRLWRDNEGLHVSMDGSVHLVSLSPSVHARWTHALDAQLLRDLLIATVNVAEGGSLSAAHHARVVLGYLLEHEDYILQPEPIQGDLSLLVTQILAEVPGRLTHIARALRFLRRGQSRVDITFSTVLLAEGSVLLVSGNGTDPPADADGHRRETAGGKLRGRLLFQPFVTRPKMFSPPTVMTANSMILEDKDADGVHRCVGCVRGLGMISEYVGLEGGGVFQGEQLCIA